MGIPTVSERIASIIGSVDSYTKVVFLPEINGWGRQPRRGMVRDLPTNGHPRRVTMESGMEWFVDADVLEKAEIAGLQVVVDGTEVTVIDNK